MDRVDSGQLTVDSEYNKSQAPDYLKSCIPRPLATDHCSSIQKICYVCYMNKLILFFLLLITQLANAQYAKFRIDLLKMTINGQTVTFNNPIIQTDINDSSDILPIGYNPDNEKVGVQFHLIKVLTKDSSYYLPCLNFIYINNNGEIKFIPAPDPDYNNPLTKTNTSFKLINRSYKYSPNDKNTGNPFEVSYSYYVDGKGLDFNEKISPGSKVLAKVQVNIKHLAMKDSFVILKNKILNLKETPKEEQMKIGTYLNHPVILKYKITSGKMGSEENITFNSSIYYTNEKGKQEVSYFINSTSSNNIYHILKLLDVDEVTKAKKILMDCEYEVVFEK